MIINDYAKGARIVCILSLLSVISGNILDTSNVKLKGRAKGIFLSDYHNSNNSHLLLSTEGYFSIIDDNNTLNQLTQWDKPLNSTYRFSMMSNKTYYECINLGFFKCSMFNITTNEVIQSRIPIQTVFNYRPMTYSLAMLTLPNGNFAAAWYEKHTINLQIYTKEGIRLSKHLSLPVLYVNDKDPFISLDVFPNTNDIIMGYAQNSTNYVTIYSYNKNMVLHSFASLLTSRNSIYVKVLSNNCFITCLRKANPNNLCRIVNLMKGEKINNKMIITLPSNVLRILPISNRIFVLLWKKSDTELKIQLMDNSNGKLLSKEHSIMVPNEFSLDLKPKIVKLNIIKHNNEWIMPIYSLRLKNEEEYFYYEKYYIDFICFDFSIKMNSTSLTKIDFMPNIKGKTSHNLKVKFIYKGDSSLGAFIIKGNNNKYRYIEVDQMYSITEVFYFKSFNKSSIIKAQYKIVDDDTYESTEECSIIINIGDTDDEQSIQCNELIDEQINMIKREESDIDYILYINGIYFVFVLIMLVEIAIKDVNLDNFISSINDKEYYMTKYYIRQFAKRNIIFSNEKMFHLLNYLFKKYYLKRITKVHYIPFHEYKNIYLLLYVKVFFCFYFGLVESFSTLYLFKIIVCYIMITFIINRLNLRIVNFNIYYDTYTFKEIDDLIDKDKKSKKNQKVSTNTDIDQLDYSTYYEFSSPQIVFFFFCFFLYSFYLINHQSQISINNNSLLQCILQILFIFFYLYFIEYLILYFQIKICMTIYKRNNHITNMILPYIIPPYILIDISALYQYTQWKYQ